jgi:hypothetical protein
MTVESASFIDDLVATNPTTTDFLYEGDDHIRLIKAVLLASFPNVGAAVTLTHTQINSALQTSTSGQWSLMNSTTVSGTPSVVDFVNGTGGVVISALYDQYLLDFTNIKTTSGTALLRLQISENAGVTFPANATGCAWESGTVTSGAVTYTTGNGQAYVQVSGSAPASVDPGWSGRILITRPLSTVINGHVSWIIEGAGLGSFRTICGGGVMGSTTNQFDAVRLTLDGSTFAGTNARVRFYGRRA